MTPIWRKPAIAALVLLLSFAMLNCGTTASEKTEKQNLEESVQTTPKSVNVTLETTYGNIGLELWPDIAPKTVDNFVKLGGEGFYNNTYFHRVIPDFMIQGGCPNTKNPDRSDDGSGSPGYKFEDECYAPGAELTGALENDADANIVWTTVVMPYMQSGVAIDVEIRDIIDACNQAQSFGPFRAKTVEFYKEKTGFTGKVTKKGDLIAPVAYGTLCMANSGPNTNGSQIFIVTKKDGAAWLNGKHTVFGKVISGMDIVHKIENLPRDSKDNPLADNQAVVSKVRIVRD